jgi:hypothetical protein
MRNKLLKVATLIVSVAAVFLLSKAAMAATEHECDFDGSPSLTLNAIAYPNGIQTYLFVIDGRIDCMTNADWEIDLGTNPTSTFVFDGNVSVTNESCLLVEDNYYGDLMNCKFFIQGDAESLEDLSFHIEFVSEDGLDELLSPDIRLDSCDLVDNATTCVKGNEVCVGDGDIYGPNCFSNWSTNPSDTINSTSNLTLTKVDESNPSVEEYKLSGELDLKGRNIDGVFDDFVILSWHEPNIVFSPIDGIFGECVHDETDSTIDCDITVELNEITVDVDEISIKVFAHDDDTGIVWYSRSYDLSDADSGFFFAPLHIKLCWINSTDPDCLPPVEELGDPWADDDGDGFPNSEDYCPNTWSETNENTDDENDGGDACDPDDDNDGFIDAHDNCPLVINSNGQNEDVDGDGEGDACDEDIDGDGFPNNSDNCDYDANEDQEDGDGDGIGDVCDDFNDGPAASESNTSSLIPPSYIIGGGSDGSGQAGGGCSIVSPSSSVDLTLFGLLAIAWGALIIRRKK